MKSADFKHVANKLMSCLINEFLWILITNWQEWILNFIDTPWSSITFHGTPSILQGTPWNSMSLHRTSWNYMAFHGTPWILHGIPWILHTTPWHSMELHEYSMELHGYSMELLGTPWKFHGNPWISMEFHGIPWRYFTRVNNGICYSGQPDYGMRNTLCIVCTPQYPVITGVLKIGCESRVTWILSLFDVDINYHDNNRP